MTRPPLVMPKQPTLVDQSGRTIKLPPIPTLEPPPGWVRNPNDDNEARRAQIAFDAVMGLAVEMGGTITGEHGVGRLKKGWLPAQVGDDVMDLTATIKHALDPQGLLNPGVML